MSYEYNGVGFLFHATLFILAGYIGRSRRWLAIFASTALAPIANLVIGCNKYDIALSTITGFLAGLCGALLIPLFWAGRHGHASKGLHFITPISARYPQYFNWVRSDNHPDNQSNRKRWTEKNS